jgi:MarR family transcriptional regulator, transcriptional regulator for hemolysin
VRVTPDKPAETLDEFFASEDPRRALTREIMRFSRRWRVALDQALKETGQTYARWRALYFLDAVKDGVTQRELAALMGIEEPGLVRLLDALEEAGLVERRPSEQDRRSKQVRLLAPGREALETGRAAATRVLDGMFADVADEDIAACVRVIDAALTKLEERPQH